ncbi:hypothetical protein V1477_003038, partial [Vespula maculifrons]
MTVTQCSRKTGSSSKVILALKFSKLACNDFHPARQIAMQILPRVTQQLQECTKMYLEAYAVVRYSRANSICTDLYGRNVHALYEYVRVMSRIQNSELRRICGQ